MKGIPDASPTSKSHLMINSCDEDVKATVNDDELINNTVGRNNSGYAEKNVNADPESAKRINGGQLSLVPKSNVTKHWENPTTVDPDQTTRLYKIRWLILALFVLYSMSNAFQWIQYSIITNLICTYYDVSESAVNWTSMVYMVAYIPLIFPATLLLDRKGLRWVVVIGCFGTALGAWIKCASVSPDRFYVTMIGQSVAAVSQIFVLNIPPRLASVWFGAKEISTACSIGVFGNQFGVAIGFLLPPVIVPNSTNLDDIAYGLKIMFYGVAAVTTVLFVLILIIFKAEPAIPPSRAAANAKVQAALNENYLLSIYRLVKNQSYILLLISYGINTGVFYAISTLLNQQVLDYFPGETQNAGRIGLTIVLSGMAGSVICGLWLDKTHRFKETTLAIYIFSLLGMIAYTFIFQTYQIWTVFLIAGFLGFFMTGYLPVGFEFAAEITYPESEGTSAGLLNASAQVFGIIYTIAAGAMMDRYSDTVSNLVLSGMLIVGAGMTVFVKSQLKRTAAQRQFTSTDLNNGDLSNDKDEELHKPNGHCNVV